MPPERLIECGGIRNHRRAIGEQPQRLLYFHAVTPSIEGIASVFAEVPRERAARHACVARPALDLAHVVRGGQYGVADAQ